MERPATNARLRYLNDSAHLLAYSAPSTAAFFQSRYNQLVDREDVAVPDARRREICAACGFNMLWSSMYPPVHPEVQNKKRQKPNGAAPSKSNETKGTLLSCRMCHSKTEYQLPVAKRTRGASKLRRADLSPLAKTPSLHQELDSTSKSSLDTRTHTPRKRAKGRKQNSLSAMLAKSKAEAASQKSGFGLDLMDLMKGA
jgi:RNase P subunit RPR2